MGMGKAAVAAFFQTGFNYGYFHNGASKYGYFHKTSRLQAYYSALRPPATGQNMQLTVQ